MHMNRVMKQIVIGGIFLILALLVAWPFYRASNPAPSCSDGVRNGTEEGLDCGAVCGVSCPEMQREAVVKNALLVTNSDGSSDGVVTVSNPNATHGVTRLALRVVALDAAGKELSQSTQITYVNPLSDRIVVVPFARMSGVASLSATLAMGDSVWQPISASTPERVALVVRGESLVHGDTSTQYTAVVVNQSVFDVGNVDVVLLLQDSKGTVHAAASTTVRTLASGQERAFTIEFPFAVPADVVSRVAVSTNILQDGNLNITDGTHERFQEF
jgi:hypothetical protein